MTHKKINALVPCYTCGGTGLTNGRPCKTCRGRSMVRGQIEVDE